MTLTQLAAGRSGMAEATEIYRAARDQLLCLRGREADLAGCGQAAPGEFRDDALRGQS